MIAAATKQAVAAVAATVPEEIETAATSQAVFAIAATKQCTSISSSSNRTSSTSYISNTTSSSSSSIGSCGAEKSAPGGRAGRKKSAKLSVCSIKTVSEGTPPYISIMGRKNSVVTEMAAPVPDQAWVGKNTRFVKGKKGRVRKNNIYHTQANMFEDYQKRVQERMSDVNDLSEEDFEDNRDSKVSVVTTLT